MPIGLFSAPASYLRAHKTEKIAWTETESMRPFRFFIIQKILKTSPNTSETKLVERESPLNTSICTWCLYPKHLSAHTWLLDFKWNKCMELKLASTSVCLDSNSWP